ncbi:MAG TPA: glycosyltransferase family 4 protein [Planctomycetota bacterium]|nr:glycosyltransferase family 4 protein [Planctomycetota bacterium]
MKILTVVHQFLPKHHAGTEVHTHHLALAMRARGHDVEILTCEHTGDRPQYAVARRVYDGIPVHEVAFWQKHADFEETYANPRMNRVLREVAAELRPDLMHLQHPMFFGVDAVRVAADLGIPTVATLHDYWLLCHRSTFLLSDLSICEKGPRADLCAECAPTAPLVPQRYGRDDRALALPLAMERRARTVESRAALVDLFLSPSRFLRARAIRGGLADPRRIVVVEHGLPPQPAARRPPRKRGAPLRVGYVGTIADYKGIEILVRAANRLEDVPCEIAIHGALDWFPAFVERIRKLGTNPRVRWKGGFAPERGSEVLAEIDVLVVPSLWFENAPVTILEAFRAGIPVIATELGGMSESLGRGGGTTFARGDDEELASRIALFATDENAYREACLGVPRVRSDAEMAAETEQYFERVVARHRERGGRDRLFSGAAHDAMPSGASRDAMPSGASRDALPSGADRVAAEPRQGRRILLVNPFTLPESVGGVQIHLDLLARELRQRGHEVAMFRNDSSDPTAAEFSLRLAKHDGMRLHGVTYRWSDFDDGFHRLLTNPSIDRAFAEVLESERPDVVHAHGLTCLSSTMLEEAKRRGARVGLTLHDFWMGCPRGQRITRQLDLCRTIDRKRCVPCLHGMWPQLFGDEETGLADLRDYDARIRRALAAPDFLVTPSEYHRRMYIREWGLRDDRIHAVAPGLDPAPFAGLRRVASSRFRVGFIGSVIPSKGIHVLIDAVNRLPPEACVVKVHGEATPWHERTDYVSELRAKIRPDHPVELAGRYASEALPSLLAHLDVLVVPSLWFESYCLTIREGFLANVPVIASRLGPMADAIEDGVTGLLFEPGNAADLERCLRRVMDDARLRNDLARAPKSVPTIAETAERLLELYLSVERAVA